MSAIRRLAPLAAVLATLALSTFAFGVSAGLTAPRTAPVVETWPPAGITVVAHRCNTAGDIYTEQTQTACVKALAAGAETIDVDVRWTSTSTPVLLHDSTLALFGSPDTISAVSYTSARQHVSPEGQVLSTLTQLRDLVLVVPGVDLSVELKTTPTPAQWTKLDGILAPIADRVILNSFDPALLEVAAARGYDRLALNANTVPDPAAVPAVVDVVIVKASAITSQAADALVADGHKVWCFACDTPTAWQVAGQDGVTGFATDDHVAARAWVAAQS